MTSGKRRRWIFYFAIFLYGGWFFFTTSPLSHSLVDAISPYVSGWAATLIWGSWLVLLPIGIGPLRIPEALRITLYVLLLATCIFLPLAIHFHATATLYISALFCIELFWLVPRWRDKWNRTRA